MPDLLLTFLIQEVAVVNCRFGLKHIESKTLVVVDHNFKINLNFLRVLCKIGQIKFFFDRYPLSRIFMHFVRLLPVTQPKVERTHRSDGSFCKAPWAQVEAGPDSRSYPTAAAAAHAVQAAPSGLGRVHRSSKGSRSDSLRPSHRQ